MAFTLTSDRHGIPARTVSVNRSPIYERVLVVEVDGRSCEITVDQARALADALSLECAHAEWDAQNTTDAIDHLREIGMI